MRADRGDLLVGPAVVAAHGVRDVAEVAGAGGGHDRGRARGRLAVDVRKSAFLRGETVFGQAVAQELVERGDAVVVERRGGRAVDRHVLPLHAERLTVAHHLPRHVAARVLGAAALELVDRHDVGVVEHVDLLQLRRGAELRRHHVQREVDERHDRRVALTDTGRLDDHQVRSGRLARHDRLLQAVRDLAAGTARGQRAEEHAIAVEAVHPDPVAEQRAATTATGRVDGEHGDAQLVLLVEPEPAHQLVGQRRLAGTTGAGDAEHRNLAGGLDALGGSRPRCA